DELPSPAGLLRLPGFRPLSLLTLHPARDCRAEPIVLTRRDFRSGLDIGKLRERARWRAAAAMDALGVAGRDLLLLPASLRDAVLEAIASDRTERILAALREFPDLLVAVALAIGDEPSRWVEGGALSAPLEAVARGERE